MLRFYFVKFKKSIFLVKACCRPPINILALTKTTIQINVPSSLPSLSILHYTPLLPLLPLNIVFNKVKPGISFRSTDIHAYSILSYAFPLSAAWNSISNTYFNSLCNLLLSNTNENSKPPSNENTCTLEGIS